jgi:hypothetical protein
MRRDDAKKTFLSSILQIFEQIDIGEEVHRSEKFVNFQSFFIYYFILLILLVHF